MENPFEIILQKLETIESLLTNDKDIDRVVEAKEVITVDELSDYLAISKSAIYKMTSSNVIPHYKPTGKLLYFKKSEIVEWVSKSRIKTMDEIEQEAENHLRKIGRPRYG
ncbi:helix-turn-helix domain-containing protein [Roseivirga pacifica]|uniref:helix-turn-helix domain-containing protein n=1 Tax=Roseivirga pacifica TaxID=1267423 RepID=UPI002094A89B|nr:helix-turn-helix domain-containing protein [Roseivirga pacifica]MCO6359039.1 helix-turn-helix domain-containing protein [Roseivirga pacifica]MCO6365325.1 helix-turn-helix domain-containing protein [Roseivirga pacifica]MCO6371945.1 helix-turn-helix domain-containing protein [Roseivirga pacifica]MCO6375944.1 helix-turn-helix domain-containing protein [Roseivirga pacifica]MCO6379323.1 helix-turn-helix domain-containing protein [Roseivirga pacifica]